MTPRRVKGEGRSNVDSIVFGDGHMYTVNYSSPWEREEALAGAPKLEIEVALAVPCVLWGLRFDGFL